MALDWKTLEYHPRQKPKFAALDMAKNVEETGARLRMLLGSTTTAARRKSPTSQRILVGRALRPVDLLRQSHSRNFRFHRRDRPRHAPGLQLGTRPLRTLGRRRRRSHRRAHEKRRRPVAANVEKLLASGQKSWYADDPKTPSGRKYFDLATASWQPVEVPAGVWSVEVAKKSNGVVKKNSGASLVDLGDGVGCIEFHSKMNALGADIISLILQTLKARRPGRQLRRLRHHQRRAEFFRRRQPDAPAHVRAGRRVGRRRPGHPPVPGHDAGHQILAEAGGDRALRIALGGGCEVSLHAAARQPHAELYMGLVEVGVGLLPGGGGCKEMLLRAVDSAASIRPDGRGANRSNCMEAMKKAFETIATAKVATSAHEARGLGFLSTPTASP
jgi:3-hydroxyacyl-CoA dehydrogenase